MDYERKVAEWLKEDTRQFKSEYQKKTICKTLIKQGETVAKKHETDMKDLCTGKITIGEFKKRCSEIDFKSLGCKY